MGLSHCLFIKQSGEVESFLCNLEQYKEGHLWIGPINLSFYPYTLTIMGENKINKNVTSFEELVISFGCIDESLGKNIFENTATSQVFSMMKEVFLGVEELFLSLKLNIVKINLIKDKISIHIFVPKESGFLISQGGIILLKTVLESLLSSRGCLLYGFSF